MPSHAGRTRQGKSGSEENGILGARPMFRRLGWSRRDAVGFMVGAFATIAILINMLFMQSGSHPAPMFKNAAVAVKPAVAADSPPAVVPRPRPAEPAPAPATKGAALPAARAAGGDHQRHPTRTGAPWIL